MRQFQVIVEHSGQHVFSTDWVTGREKAEPLAMLLASKFPTPYVILVAGRTIDLHSVEWNEFVAGELA